MVTLGPLESLGSSVLEPESKGGPIPSLVQSRSEATVVAARLTQALAEASRSKRLPKRPPLADGPGYLSSDEARTYPQRPNSISSGELHQRVERNLLHAAGPAAATGEGMIALVEQQSGETPSLTLNRRLDWQENPVEDNQLTYSVPGSAVRLTVREASSARFAGTSFTRNFSLSSEDTTRPFGLAPELCCAGAEAKSQKVDWTLVDLKNFGVTAFGYHSEVGRNFQSFGQNKREFATAGTSTVKAGGQVRVGAFGFGFAQSSIANMEDSDANFSGVQREATVSLDVPHLLPGMQPSVSKLLPTLWVSASDKQTSNPGRESAASDAISTSFGATWGWNFGYATLGYWKYFPGSHASETLSWSGQGIDANLGAYYSSFGIDVGFSYGQSEDTSPSWQSAAALYNSSATASYKPDKLPGISVTVAAGNYDHNAIAFGSTSLNSYAVTTNGEYISFTTGLDLTNWLWSSQAERTD